MYSKSQWPIDYNIWLDTHRGTMVYLNDCIIHGTLIQDRTYWTVLGIRFTADDISHVLTNLIDDDITIVLKSV